MDPADTIEEKQALLAPDQKPAAEEHQEGPPELPPLTEQQRKQGKVHEIKWVVFATGLLGAVVLTIALLVLYIPEAVRDC